MYDNGLLDERIKDYEWQKILDDLNIDIETNIEFTGNFKQDYFRTMKSLVDSIKSNPYMESRKKEDKKKLTSDLYTLGRMFYGYRGNVNKYYEKYDKNNYDKECIPKWNTQGGYLPTSHNYNTYLQYMTPALYEHYYLLQVNVIEEFIHSFAKQPKYLYELHKLDGKTWFVSKLELFMREDIDIEGDNLRLPEYYSINKKLMDLSYYKELYRKCLIEHRFPLFVEEEYPILQWIEENRKNEHFENEKIPCSFLVKKKMNVLDYLINIKDDEIINLEDLSYYYDIEREEVLSIMEELIGNEEHGGKVVKDIDENGNTIFIKKDTFSPVGKSYLKNKGE